MNNCIKQAIIIAGGMGTRLKPFTDNNPKPMYPISGKPFLGYLLEQIKDFGIEKVVLLLGYKAEKIIDYIDSEWKDDSLDIICKVTPLEYDTGARIKNAQEIMDEHFLFMYCDNYCTIDFKKLVSDYYNNGAMIQITAYENKDGYTKNNLIIDENGLVTCYDKTRTVEGLLGVDIGYAIINRRVVELFGNENENFEKRVYPELVRKNKLYATVTKQRYYSVGSWERIKLTESFFDDKKVVFLDRDGTLNVRPPKACYIERKEDFIWLDGAIEAFKMLKENGYIVILVSNQPGIARGNLTEETLFDINNSMQQELERGTGYKIDYIYYCPHNWDEGCECRKPKPGMLFQAQKDININLYKSILIGDDERDIEAGNAAGCTCYQVTDDRSLLDIVRDII